MHEHKVKTTSRPCLWQLDQAEAAASTAVSDLLVGDSVTEMLIVDGAAAHFHSVVHLTG